MAISPELVGLIREGLDRALPREWERIADILTRAGWPPDQVRRALAGFADVESPIPVPQPTVSTRPREAFLHVVMFMALFVSAFSLGAVLFRLIDLALPDPAGLPPEVSRELLRLSVSALAVASPLFAFVARIIRRDVEAQPGSRASRIRLQQCSSDVQVSITDPVTHAPYGCEAGAGTAYELCATFELATTARDLRRGRPFSRHEAGRHCFPLRADPDRGG